MKQLISSLSLKRFYILCFLICTTLLCSAFIITETENKNPELDLLLNPSGVRIKAEKAAVLPPSCGSDFIPDFGCSSGNSLNKPLLISGVSGSSLGTNVYIDYVDVIIAHGNPGDLDIYLKSPNGTEIELSTDNGDFGLSSSTPDNYGNPDNCPSQVARFASWASLAITAAGQGPFIGNFRPEGNFSDFNGQAPNGTWTLRVCDDSAVGVPGSLIYFDIGFTNCPPLLNTSISNVNPQGATINWSFPGSAVSYDIEIQPSGTAPTGNPTVSSVSGTSYTWTGGTGNTTYKVWLRSNCAGSNSRWTGPLSFTVPLDNAVPSCMNIAIPDDPSSSSFVSSNILIPIDVNTTGNTLGTDVFMDGIDLIITHTEIDQIDAYLISPSGTEIILTTDNGGHGDSYGNPNDCPNAVTTLGDWAGTNITEGTVPFIDSFKPEG